MAAAGLLLAAMGGGQGLSERETATGHDFLSGVALRRVRMPPGIPFRPIGLALGVGASALEVVVASHQGEPALPSIRSAWKARKGGRAAPLLLVVLYGDKAALCGPAGDDAPAYVGLDPGQVERICREALDQPDRHAALRALRDSVPAVESDLAGIRNEGFLATHELRVGARKRADWENARERSLPVLSKRGEEMLSGLGFQIEAHDRVVSILRAGDRKVGVAVLLKRDEAPELQAERFSSLSPITYALAVADRENLPYVVLQHGAKVRVYPSRVGVGVGRRGRTETYVECHAGLLRDRDAAYLSLLCSAEALKDGGSLEQIIEESGRFAGSLAERLRERIYQSVVPCLSEGIVIARGIRKANAQDLSDTYEMTMAVLFRLLFIAYAEDKDLLPYRWNGLYRRRSLKTKSQELLELARTGTGFDEGDSLWDEISRLFRAVDRGNREWGVPPYDGGLFSEDPEVSHVSSLLAGIKLPNTVVGPALQHLLLVDTAEGLGPVDFRSLGVREFGTVYEGLLESELSSAATDLSVGAEGIYRPSRKDEEPLVRKGQIYLHDASGARKASGSYFTKQFAVEHLLERSLEPALAHHLARLDGLDEDTAGEQFFDFRVADIAMGSAHFLVAAVDHIERGLTDYLSRRSLVGVVDELNTLRVAAREALGSLADQVEIEDTQLLRRLIARRCIYGVDINSTAVQLARLALWIHTFVPGLPLSLLDHNLRCGNSLVGIASFSELSGAIESESLPLFPIDASYLLGDAKDHLRKLARIADANLPDLKRARAAMEAAQESISPTSALCDLVTAARIEGKPVRLNVEDWDDFKTDLFRSAEVREARRSLSGLTPFHFPIGFPEVFLRPRQGFDVIVGNPPWQEATIEEDTFWGRYMPGGLRRSLTQREQERVVAKFRAERPDLYDAYKRERDEVELTRKALGAGQYPGMGTGDPDLYKAFCWRFWHLVSDEGGRIGVVLPRSALNAKGSAEFRKETFEHGDDIDITTLLNTRGWVFDEAEHRYTIGLVALEKQQQEETPVALRGPYSSLDRYRGGILKDPAVFYGEEIEQWNDTASLPLLPSEESVEVFAQLRKSPRLDLNDKTSWRARPHRELDATNDKKYMDVDSEECPDGFWPVYKGESFDLWNPDTGTYYAWADPEKVVAVLQAKRIRAGKNKRSPLSEFPASWLRDPKKAPCLTPRVAFRDATKWDNRRTVIVALVPPSVFIANQAPYLLWPRGEARDQAFLLGIFSSIPLDWYARRFVETHLNFFVFNPLPVPRPRSDDPLAGRAVELAGRLAAPDDRFKDWAREVGVSCGLIGAEEKEAMIDELDAVVAHLYRLSQEQLIHIFETFHEGWDYEERLRSTLKYFKEWRNRS